MKRRSFISTVVAACLTPLGLLKPAKSDVITIGGVPIKWVNTLTDDTYYKIGVVIGGGHGRPIRVCT